MGYDRLKEATEDELKAEIRRRRNLAQAKQEMQGAIVRLENNKRYVDGLRRYIETNGESEYPPYPMDGNL